MHAFSEAAEGLALSVPEQHSMVWYRGIELRSAQSRAHVYADPPRPRKEAEAAVYIALSCKRSKYGIADAIGGATERPMISDLRCEESDHR